VIRTKSAPRRGWSQHNLKRHRFVGLAAKLLGYLVEKVEVIGANRLPSISSSRSTSLAPKRHRAEPFVSRSNKHLAHERRPADTEGRGNRAHDHGPSARYATLLRVAVVIRRYTNYDPQGSFLRGCECNGDCYSCAMNPPRCAI
jgi:hypothetical protein